MSDALLSVEGVSVRYGDFSAAESISFSIERGHIVSLIGLNGAGKTTIVNTVMGLHKPESGRIVFKGEDITSLSTDFKGTFAGSLGRKVLQQDVRSG